MNSTLFSALLLLMPVASFASQPIIGFMFPTINTASRPTAASASCDIWTTGFISPTKPYDLSNEHMFNINLSQSLLVPVITNDLYVLNAAGIANLGTSKHYFIYHKD